MQLRYQLQLPIQAANIHISTNEKIDEERPVSSAQWVELAQLPNYIPWTKGLAEYECVMNS